MVGSLRRSAMRRGPLGGSKQWTLVWALLIGVRLLKRFTKSKDEVVFSHRLQPGETLLISGDDGEPRILPS